MLSCGVSSRTAAARSDARSEPCKKTNSECPPRNWDASHLKLLRLPIGGSVSECQLARARNLQVRCPVLIAERVAAYDNRLSPARDETGNILCHNRLPEDGAVENVPDGSVWRFPHLLEAELLYPSLVGGDSGALDAHVVLLYRVCCFYGDLKIFAFSVQKILLIIPQACKVIYIGVLGSNLCEGGTHGLTHVLEAQLLDARLVGSDSGAVDALVVLRYRVRCAYCELQRLT